MADDFNLFEGFEDIRAQEEGTPPPEPADTLFDGFEEITPTEDPGLRNLKLVRGRAPAAEAKALKDSMQTGAPTPFTRANPTYNKFDLFRDFDNATESVKNIARKGTLDAGISQNDLPQLSVIDRILNEPLTIGGVLKSGAAGAAAGLVTPAKFVGETHELVSDLINEKLLVGNPLTKTFGEAIEETERLREFDKSLDVVTLGGVSRNVQDWFRSKIGPAKAEQLIGQSAEVITTMLSAWLTGGEGVILPILSASAGVGKATEARREGADMVQALGAGFTQAAIEYLTEKIPLDILRSRGISFFTKLAGGLLTDVPGELLAAWAEVELVDVAILEKAGLTREQWKETLMDTFLVSALTVVGTTTPTHMIQSAIDRVDADAAQSTAFNDRTTRAGEETDKSETKALSDQQMKVAIREMDGDEDVHITEDGIERIYQTDDPELKKQADQVLLKLDIDPNEARRLASFGQDITIKHADLLASLSTEERALIMPHVKNTYENYSQHNIDEGLTEETKLALNEPLQEIQADELVFQSSLNRIRNQITATRSEKEAEANIAKLESFANQLTLQNQDRIAFLDKINIEKVPFKRKAADFSKRILQIPTTEAEALSQDIAQLTTRINKIDPTQPGSQEAIDELTGQRAEAEQKLSQTGLEGFDLFQAERGRDPKGEFSIVLDEKGRDKVIISLFERADVSTIPHELGHLFLTEMTQVADTAGITEQFKADMQSVNNFLGVKEGATEYTIPQQEKFARSWEQWLREGKAPNDALQSVFTRFKLWLTEIYKSQRRLNVKLSAEIRGVFNRMLASDSETLTASAFNNVLPPTTERMNELGVPNDEQPELKRLVDRAISDASNALFRAKNNAVREATPRFKQEAEAEARAEDTQDVYKTIDTIKQADLFFKVTKSKEKALLNRQEFIETYGKDAINDLPAKGLLINDGVSLDDAAVTYEFASADEMMEAFFNTPPLQDAIDFRVGLKIQELENTFTAEDFLAQSKDYASYIEIMGDHLRNAAVRSGDTTKRKATTKKQMKSLAQNTIDQMSVSESQRTDKFLSAVKRAGVAMRKAEKANDWAKAIRENQKMQLNKEMGNISVKNKKLVEKSINRAKKYKPLGKPASVSHQYREGVRSLSERFLLVPGVAPQRPVSLETFNKLLKGGEFVGNFDASQFLINPNTYNDTRDYRKLSMEEFKEIDKLVKFFTTQGKHEQGQFLSDGKTKLQDEARPMLAEMDAQKQTKKLDKHNILRGVVEGSDEWFARMLNLSYITTALGGYQSLTGGKSKLEEGVTERAKDLRDDQLGKFRQVREEVKPDRDHIVNAQRKIIKEHGRKLFVSDNGVPVPHLLQDNGSQLNYWEPEQIFSMAFNRGNDSNTEALLRGYPGLTLGQVDTLLNKYLTPADINAVQNIIDAMNKLAPETDAVHVRIKGYHMERVQPRPWTFKGKTYDGGYYPLSIDRDLATKENDVFASSKEEQEYFDTADKTYVTPFAKSTHTLTRKDGHGLPVNLRLSVIDKHIDKTTRYITMAEGIRDIDRIVTYKEKVLDEEGNQTGETIGFKKSATRIMGDNVYNQIRPALQHFVNPVLQGVDTPGRKFISYLRSVAVPAHIALKTLTGVKQLSSLSSGIHDLGKDGKSGVKKWVNGSMFVASNPSGAYQTMLDKSAFMLERLKSWERDFLKSRFDKMTPAQREVSFGDRHVTWKDVVDFGYVTVRIPDLITVTPLWWGGYISKMNEGVTEKEAVRYADNIIEDTQPTAQPLDLSAWFREGGFWSMFNLHQTFTVGNYGQRQRTWFRAWRKGEVSFSKYAMFNYMDAALPITLMTLLISYLRGGDLSDPEEWEEVAGDVITNWAFMGVPMATSTYNALTEGWNSPLEVAGAREIERSFMTARLIIRGFKEGMSEKEKERAIWGVAEIISLQLRVPISQVAKQLLEGETIPEKAFKQKRKRGDN